MSYFLTHIQCGYQFGFVCTLDSGKIAIMMSFWVNQAHCLSFRETPQMIRHRFWISNDFVSNYTHMHMRILFDINHSALPRYFGGEYHSCPQPPFFSQKSACDFAGISARYYLTHWGRVTHICVVKLTIIGSDNGLSPRRCQAIIWTNAGIVSIGPLGTNFIGILIGIQTFPFKKMHLKMSSAKWRPFCLGLTLVSSAWRRRPLIMPCL